LDCELILGGPALRGPRGEGLSLHYNISAALLGLTEEEVRRKGEQQGSVRWKHGAWQIRFSEWQSDEAGNMKYASVERRVDGDFPHTAKGQRQAEQAGYEQWVSKANAENKVPQGLATLEQFYTLRFQVDHVDRLEKGGREHYSTIWRNHIQPTFGGIQMREIVPQMVQRLVSSKIAAGCSPQVIYHVRNCLSAMFRHARNLRFLEGPLPTDGISMREMVRKERNALTWEQVLMLADQMRVHRNVVIVLAQTGMRIG
jgi:hypothetical protein